ncbi:hypothetical protein R3P38DRAFT_3240093 [Favolaschia claudopus]|uniref:Uncharacterized protein n=1 Tax=Favolaschia claudopus TaxID=2862362 RepID=A0AAV9Z6Q2_9AGAR
MTASIALSSEMLQLLHPGGAPALCLPFMVILIKLGKLTYFERLNHVGGLHSDSVGGGDPVNILTADTVSAAVKDLLDAPAHPSPKSVSDAFAARIDESPSPSFSVSTGTTSTGIDPNLSMSVLASVRIPTGWVKQWCGCHAHTFAAPSFSALAPSRPPSHRRTSHNPTLTPQLPPHSLNTLATDNAVSVHHRSAAVPRCKGFRKRSRGETRLMFMRAACGAGSQHKIKSGSRQPAHEKNNAHPQPFAPFHDSAPFLVLTPPTHH